MIIGGVLTMIRHVLSLCTVKSHFRNFYYVTDLNVKPGHLNISSIVEQSTTLVLNQVMLHFPEACQMPSLTTIYSLLVYYEISSVVSICYMS